MGMHTGGLTTADLKPNPASGRMQYGGQGMQTAKVGVAALGIYRICRDVAVESSATHAHQFWLCACAQAVQEVAQGAMVLLSDETFKSLKVGQWEKGEMKDICFN